MKGKKLKPRILYPARLSLDLMEKSKAFQTRKVERIQHNQTNFITNAKGTSPGRKHTRRKRPIEKTQDNLENGSRIIHTDNYLKCKWIKCTNQKTDWLDWWKHVHVCTSSYHITLLDPLQIIYNYSILLG